MSPRVSERSQNSAHERFQVRLGRIICIGHQAATKTHAYEEHPISVSFDAAYIGDGSLWASATIEVTGTVADRMSDIMLVVDNSAAMADMLPMVSTNSGRHAVISLKNLCCSGRFKGVCST